MIVPSFLRCRHSPEFWRRCRFACTCALIRAPSSFGLNVRDAHPQKLSARIAIMFYRRFIDLEETQCLQIIDPHRQRIILEKERKLVRILIRFLPLWSWQVCSLLSFKMQSCSLTPLAHCYQYSLAIILIETISKIKFLQYFSREVFIPHR